MAYSGKDKRLHAKKNEYEKLLLLIERKVKKIDTKPLLEPPDRRDKLTMEEKNALDRRYYEYTKVSSSYENF